jgi:uncharacterized membrane protein YphA (DoxX/SURF4 family)
MLSIFFNIAVLLIRLVVGGLFLLAGGAKLRNGELQFFSDILAYDLLPPFLVKGLTAWFPLLEIEVGVLLILGLFTRIAAVAGLLLLVVFTGAVIIALLQHKDISCGCFGRQERIRQKRWIILSRNASALVILGLIFFLVHTSLALDDLFPLLQSIPWWLGTLALIIIVTIVRFTHSTWRKDVFQLP